VTSEGKVKGTFEGDSVTFGGEVKGTFEGDAVTFEISDGEDEGGWLP